jgi:hypothetical protein
VVFGPSHNSLLRSKRAHFGDAGSTCRRNKGVKISLLGFQLRGLTWSFVWLNVPEQAD